MILRDYQSRTIQQLYEWFEAGNEGNPCLVLPTGSGKSHIVAALCKDAIQNWPETRILMLTHVKELIEQNAEKMRQHWPGAPMGIYSASIGRRDLGEPITFAGIQSVRNKARDLGHVDLCIIDECFVAGTPVMTPSGEVAIDKVRCGDTILTQAGFGVVEAVSCRQTQETFRVELSNEQVIECTGNHPFFTESGWKQARNLERGARLFGVEDMSVLWASVSSLDCVQCGESSVLHVGTGVGKTAFLLGEVCKEIVSDGVVCGSAQTNEQALEGNQAQANSAWRQRAIAAFAAVGVASRSGGGVGGRSCNQNECRAFERHISKRIQGGHLQSSKDDCHRIGRMQPRVSRKAGARPQEDRFAGQPWVVSVSRVQRESPIAVFNLQVSGHPSYFAGGVAVHNCHLINHHDAGGYRTLLANLKGINPHLRVVGLTATPYRLGHGLITDKPALFDALLDPVSIEELVHKGFLSNLRSKVTQLKLSAEGVHKRGGEYIEAELQAAVDTKDQNERVVREVISLAGDRKAWLFFCAGVKHAENVCQVLTDHGIPAACVTGETPKKQREQILADFKAGHLRALTNANVLTTGFDHPDIDLIAMLRPTMSAGLYVQMAGRGMRVKSHTDHCLVLDFAGVVAAHGPITAVQPPKKGQEGTGEAPVRVCANCGELCAIAARMCSACGFVFPLPEGPKLKLRDDDIMGLEGTEMRVRDWMWREHTSRASGNLMLSVSYYGDMSDPVITEYLPVLHAGYAGQKAMQQLYATAERAGAVLAGSQSLADMAQAMNQSTPPNLIEYKRDGKFFRVLTRRWDHGNETTTRASARHPMA